MKHSLLLGLLMALSVAVVALAQSHGPVTPADSWLAKQVRDLQARLLAVEALSAAALPAPSPTTPDSVLYWVDGELTPSPY